ncbi:uncharacterized protein K489DRAFT_27051 [Dissoconium aciculare CBS 342.82]|uniref:Uncharacterized protein n=1 Tax=Dissoconium aciculare CBS 342.82 TaxID=1314786 RepID=A0A6J3MIN4_9PEZI|nr:uncharacterized protein K489DRAFT_27051 [Dissoconium aciculare CBS 342.82]KAF1827768.1 hypothetical protein K489DRAFT_27051 [Dissoconium aciculare CBS 342.82]
MAGTPNNGKHYCRRRRRRAESSKEAPSTSSSTMFKTLNVSEVCMWFYSPAGCAALGLVACTVAANHFARSEIRARIRSN